MIHPRTESILQARAMDPEIHARIVRAARVRGITVARYLEAMVALVDEMRVWTHAPIKDQPDALTLLDKHDLDYVKEG